jgi:hypothetical protein
MEPSSSNQKIFRTAATIVVTAIVQAVVFCLMIGLPLPQFFSSRDVESLQFQQLPEQKRTQPIQALENPAPAPEPVEAPVPQKQKIRSKKHIEKTEPIAESTPQPQPVSVIQPADHTKVLVVNFEKSKDEEKSKAEDQVTEKPSNDEKPKFIPVSDKLADVQADDSKTEATADVSESPTDGDSSAAMESMEKTTPPSN